ncbi:MAG TPA: hypothetical protein PK095_02940, partial [Myxococcota bacterium]|nr:hypothetical protein [Myxococcota bacterium]
MRMCLPLVFSSLLLLAACGKSATPAADSGAPPTPAEAGDSEAPSDAALPPATDASVAAEVEPGAAKDCVPNEVSEVIGGMDTEISR